jgi:hypothetical protein
MIDVAETATREKREGDRGVVGVGGEETVGLHSDTHEDDTEGYVDKP